VASSAFADLSVLVGPSGLVDRQNEIFGAALGLNVTLWGLVPNRPNLGVVGIIDTLWYLGSSSDVYDFNDKDNKFGFNVNFGFGHVFTLAREIQLTTFAFQVAYSEETFIKVLSSYGIGRTYPYSEDFDIVEAIDEADVLPWEREEDSSRIPEIGVQYVPITRERRLHAGLGLNLNISPIYDITDQTRSGFFIGLGGSLIYVSRLKPDYYDARVVGITEDVIVSDTVKRLWYPGGRPQIVELTFFFDIFDLFGIDEPGYQFNYDNKFGILFSVSLWGRHMQAPGSDAAPVKGIIVPLSMSSR
jgi:hypothetical protein